MQETCLTKQLQYGSPIFLYTFRFLAYRLLQTFRLSGNFPEIYPTFHYPKFHVNHICFQFANQKGAVANALNLRSNNPVLEILATRLYWRNWHPENISDVNVYLKKKIYSAAFFVLMLFTNFTQKWLF